YLQDRALRRSASQNQTRPARECIHLPVRPYGSTNPVNRCEEFQCLLAILSELQVPIALHTPLQWHLESDPARPVHLRVHRCQAEACCLPWHNAKIVRSLNGRSVPWSSGPIFPRGYCLRVVPTDELQKVGICK